MMKPRLQYLTAIQRIRQIRELSTCFKIGSCSQTRNSVMQKTILRTRQAIAELAAQYIAEDGLITYHAAKRKAADQLGFKQKDLPTNIEIERAVISYQNLFQNSFQPEELFKLRTTAIDVHLFSDNPEAISDRLMENSIPYKNSERRIRTTDKNTIILPAYCFLAGHMSVVLIIFPEKQFKQMPVCPIDEKPMKRANIKKLQSLIQESR